MLTILFLKLKIPRLNINVNTDTSIKQRDLDCKALILIIYSIFLFRIPDSRLTGVRIEELQRFFKKLSQILVGIVKISFIVLYLRFSFVAV